jgi:hypothetical protein
VTGGVERFQVDDIIDDTSCKLVVSYKNDKGGQGNDKPRRVFHCNLIPADYAKVMVLEVHLDHIEDHFGFF